MSQGNHFRLLAWGLAMLVGGGLVHAAEPAAAPPAAAPRPALVVVVSIDQFPFEYLERMRDGFAPDGLFLRIEREGALFDNCHHAHAFTLTGPGHSVLLTGATPAVTGIVDNDWFDRTTGRTMYCVSDPDCPLIGAPERDKGISPRNLLCGTLGDVLKLSTAGRAKVYGVALKDRAAVLMAGHLADDVFWFDSSSGNWITSAYYRDDLPAYLRVYNESDRAERFGGQAWELLLPRKRYTEFYPDDAAFESRLPLYGAKFPHPLPKADVPGYFKLMPLSPFGNDLTLEVARLVVEAEELGADDIPDLLCVNLSSNDYVGHAFGPQSLEVQDITLRTDRQLGEFVRWIERRLEGRPWVLALSSDHGVGPVPEYAAELGLPAGRVSGAELKQLERKIEERLRKQFGSLENNERYVRKLDDKAVYLDTRLSQLAEPNYATAQRVVRDTLLDEPRVAAAFTREELLGGELPTALGRRFQLTFHPTRSGDVIYCWKPYWLPPGDVPASHGSPWGYDTHVPLAFLGSGIRTGRFHEPVAPPAMAATLARLLRIDPPEACAFQAAAAALLGRGEDRD